MRPACDGGHGESAACEMPVHVFDDDDDDEGREHKPAASVKPRVSSGKETARTSSAVVKNPAPTEAAERRVGELIVAQKESVGLNQGKRGDRGPRAAPRSDTRPTLAAALNLPPADAAEIRMRAERRVGELIVAQKETIGLATGGKPYQGTPSKSEGVKPTADAAEIRMRAERRVGELIQQQKKSVGLAKGKAGPGRGKAGAAAGPAFPSVLTLADAGIDDAAEIRIRAERRVGELIKAQRDTVGLSAGSRGIGNPKSGVPKENPTQPLLADAGIDKKLSARAQQLAAVPASVGLVSFIGTRLEPMTVEPTAGRARPTVSFCCWELLVAAKDVKQVSREQPPKKNCSESEQFSRERRVAELIIAQKETVGHRLAQGRRSDLVPQRNQVEKTTLTEAGIDKKLSMRAQQLAAVPAPKFEGLLAEWRDRSGRKPNGSRRISCAKAPASRRATPATPRRSWPECRAGSRNTWASSHTKFRTDGENYHS